MQRVAACLRVTGRPRGFPLLHLVESEGNPKGYLFDSFVFIDPPVTSPESVGREPSISTAQRQWYTAKGQEGACQLRTEHTLILRAVGIAGDREPLREWLCHGW